jgi:hypothetical protein
MRILASLAAGICLAAGFGSLAQAECQFSPFSFFPDRNDHVTVQVATDAKSFCAMKFREGAGYHFTSASFAKAPPHGVLAKTGSTAFLYRAFDNYRGREG